MLRSAAFTCGIKPRKERTAKYIAIDRERCPASFASHSFAAFSATTSNTGWISVGETGDDPRISLVAVCCSSASVSCRLLSCSSRLSQRFAAQRSSSCWRSSAIVCACSATDVFTTGRRSVAFLLLEPFLVVLAIKQNHNELLLAGKRKYDRIGSRRWNKVPSG